MRLLVLVLKIVSSGILTRQNTPSTPTTSMAAAGKIRKIHHDVGDGHKHSWAKMALKRTCTLR
jgi:hypothetical protein